jgi:ABC-type sugar transport system substrate-binding protein
VVPHSSCSGAIADRASLWVESAQHGHTSLSIVCAIQSLPAFLLALALAGLTCGCSRQNPAESGGTVAARPDGQPFKFVVVSHATAVPFFVPVRKGVEEAGKLLGVDATFTGPPGFDISRQVEFIQAAIAGGADGIATTMPNPDAFNDVVPKPCLEAYRSSH